MANILVFINVLITNMKLKNIDDPVHSTVNGLMKD